MIQRAKENEKKTVKIIYCKHKTYLHDLSVLWANYLILASVKNDNNK